MKCENFISRDLRSNTHSRTSIPTEVPLSVVLIILTSGNPYQCDSDSNMGTYSRRGERQREGRSEGKGARQLYGEDRFNVEKGLGFIMFRHRVPPFYRD